jgi:nucleotide-binding universal stress UspA family protein
MKPARRVLVGVKTADDAAELTSAACRLAAAGGELLLVHVLEIPARRPLSADVPAEERASQQILRAAARLARRTGRRVRAFEARSRNAGEALANFLQQEKIELVVLGCRGARRAGQSASEGAAEHILRRAACRVALICGPKKA